MRGELVLILLLGFVFFLMAMISYLLYGAIAPVVAPLFTQYGVSLTYFTGWDAIFNSMDGYVVIFIIVISLALPISAFYIQSHPVFFIFAFVINVIELIFAIGVQSMFTSLSTLSVFSGIIANFPLSFAFASVLPIFAVVISGITVIVMYAKSGFASGGGL